jgi:hypothetical protein
VLFISIFLWLKISLRKKNLKKKKFGGFYRRNRKIFALRSQLRLRLLLKKFIRLRLRLRNRLCNQRGNRLYNRRDYTSLRESLVKFGNFFVLCY